MTKTIKQKAVSSGIWVIFGHLFSQVLRLGGNLALTRLLVPEMFGVMAIVTVIMVGLTMFSDVGLLQNIVQSKHGEEPSYLNTAWTIQVIRGFLIFFIALVVSYTLYFLQQEGYLSEKTVYGNAELPLILATMASTAIISGLNSIYLLLLNRKLMMAKLVTIELISQVLGLIIMLTWAWYNPSIWALVYGVIVGAIIKMILSHSINIGERCCFQWDRPAVHEIIHFGKWIFLSSILGFLLSQGDRVLLGGMVSPELLGVYTVAFFLANALKEVMTKLIASVFYPVLSETFRNSPEKVEKIYYKIRNKIDAITFFVAGFIFSTGDVIIKTLYDSRYAAAGWMLQILSLSIVCTGFLLSKECFLAYGKSKIVTVTIFIQTVAFYLVLPYLFSKYGMLGAVWAMVVVSVVQIIISSIFMKIYIFYDFRNEFIMVPLILIGLVFGETGKEILFMNDLLPVGSSWHSPNFWSEFQNFVTK